MSRISRSIASGGASLRRSKIKAPARGLALAEREIYANGVRKVAFRHPDGNEFGFGLASL